MPWFLREKIPNLRVGNDVSILKYFPETEDNGVNIKWARGVNTVDKLERALYSGKLGCLGKGLSNVSVSVVSNVHISKQSNSSFSDTVYFNFLSIKWI